MSGRNHDTRAYPKRRNAISGQFAARPIEMLESHAYRALSVSAHMVISRIEIELAHHGGNDNGQLPVTVDQFVEYGMHRSSVAPAIREAEALGFIRVERGRGGNADYHRPNKFYLTFSNWRGAKAEPPSHDWKRIKSMDEAQRIAREARAAATLLRAEARLARRVPYDLDKDEKLDPTQVLEEAMRHFYRKAKIEESLGRFCDFRIVDNARCRTRHG